MPKHQFVNIISHMEDFWTPAIKSWSKETLNTFQKKIKRFWSFQQLLNVIFQTQIG